MKVTDFNLRVTQVPIVARKYGLDEDLGHRSLAVCAHRRVGKSRAISKSLSLDAQDCLKEESIYRIRGDVDSSYPLYSFLAPTIRQARQIIWKYLLEDFRHFPGVNFNNSTLSVTIPRPKLGDYAEFQLYASRFYDRIRGTKQRKAHVDEVQDCPQDAIPYAISPALKDSGGSLGLTGTADSGGPFSEIMKRYIREGRECYLFPVDKTGVFTEKEIKEIRAEVGEEAFLTEYMCRFDVIRHGTFLGHVFRKLERYPTFFDGTYDTNLPLVMSFDLGLGEGFCGWTMQVKSKQEAVLLDYFEDYEGVSEIREDLEKTGRIPDYIFLPHDGKRRVPGAVKAVSMEQLFKRIFPKSKVRSVERPSNKRRAIENVAQHLHLFRFPDKKASTDAHRGRAKLKKYAPKMDKITNLPTDVPDKSQGNDHAFDALQTGMIGLRVRDGRINKVPVHRIQGSSIEVQSPGFKSSVFGLRSASILRRPRILY